MNKNHIISKTLSANDVGETGAHQAGILVPKEKTILTFFPQLGTNEKNPRELLFFEDESGNLWKMYFIFYNNSFFGGTRNEYRLTHMTAFFKKNNLKAGDEIFLEKDENGKKLIKFKKNVAEKNDKNILKLSGKWKVVSV